MSVQAVQVEGAVVPVRYYSLVRVIAAAEVAMMDLVRQFGLGQPALRVGESSKELHPLSEQAIFLARSYWAELDKSRIAASGAVTCLTGQITVISKLLGEGRCLVPSGVRWPVSPEYQHVFDPKPHLLVLGRTEGGRDIRSLRQRFADEIDAFVGRLGIGQIRHQTVKVARGDNHGVVIWFPHDYFLDPDRPTMQRIVTCLVDMEKRLQE